MTGRSFVAGCAALTALLVGCARPMDPPGGEPDRVPPQVVATEPEAMAVVPGWDDEVVIRFDERISERGIKQSVMVSPETGEVRVDKGRRELRISVEGGWRPNQVYRVVVLPVVQDLFNNRRQEAIDLVFSTGPPIASTALAGLVEDRLTGRPVRDARVEAVRRVDSVVYVAMTDTAGFYALRHIPAGAYDLRAYLDRSPNRTADFSEPVDTGVVSLAVNDTVVHSFSLLAGDTTAARLVRAEAPDSSFVRLHLDDAVDAGAPLDGIEVELLRLPDSTAVAVAEVLHAHAFESRLAEQRAAAAAAAAARDSLAGDSIAGDSIAAETAAADSAAGDSAAVDTVAAAAAGADRADSAAAVPGAPAGDTLAPGGAAGGAAAKAADPVAADTAPPLPSRELVLVPAEPLPPDAVFVVVVRGVTNLHGIGGGGGSVEFRTPKRPEPPPGEAADSVPAIPPPADSPPTVPPDTARLR